jgi:hypothetical protein
MLKELLYYSMFVDYRTIADRRCAILTEAPGFGNAGGSHRRKIGT